MPPRTMLKMNYSKILRDLLLPLPLEIGHYSFKSEVMTLVSLCNVL